MKHLSYDFAHMRSSGSGEGGIRPDELIRLHDPLLAAHARLGELQREATQGFFDLPYDDDAATLVLDMAAKAKKLDLLIVIGIGGSDLAARTIIQALKENPSTGSGRGGGMAVKFLSAPDPEAIAPLLADKDLLSRSAINVVSKSGTTLETLALFFTLRDALVKAVGLEAHRKHVFVTTDPADGPLHALAKDEGYAILPHPLNVGGRFSALSVVGLFPAACAGIDPRAILAGARAVEDERRSKGVKSDPATFAALQYLALHERKQHIHVLMPYATRLTSFASWYRQIWAESLGKKKGTGHVGPTPVAAVGPIDQHSQLQLYNEGPKDKTITFIEVDSFRHDLSVPRVQNIPHDLAYLEGLSFTDIMHAERKGTANALARHHRPNGTILIPNITPESVGALFQFFMTATAYMGELMGVNTYDQPGVEAGKQEARAILEGHL